MIEACIISGRDCPLRPGGVEPSCFASEVCPDALLFVRSMEIPIEADETHLVLRYLERILETDRLKRHSHRRNCLVEVVEHIIREGY